MVTQLFGKLPDSADNLLRAMLNFINNFTGFTGQIHTLLGFNFAFINAVHRVACQGLVVIDYRYDFLSGGSGA